MTDPAPEGDNEHDEAIRVARLSVAASVIVAVIVIVTNVLNARVYGAEVLGLFALSSSPWLLTLAISNFGENAALVRLLAVERERAPSTRPVTAAALLISTAWTSLISVIVLLIAGLGLRQVDTDANLFLAAAILSLTFVVIVNPTWILQSAFVAFGKGRDIFISRLIQPGLFLVLSTALAYSDKSVTSLVWASVGSAAAGLAFVAVRAATMLGGSLRPAAIRDGRDSIKSLLSFAWRWAPGNLANALTSQAGLWAVAGLGGTFEAGVYSRVLGLQERAGDLSARLQDGVVPALVRHQDSGDRDKFAAAWWAVLGPALSAAMIVIPVAMISSPAAMRILGDDFASGGRALMWVSLTVGFMLLLAGLSGPFIALNRPGTSSLISIGRAVALIPVLIPLTSRYGAAGAAGAFTVVIGLECIVRLTIMAPHLQLRAHAIDSGLLSHAGLGAATATLGTVAMRAFLPSGTAGELTAGAIGAAAGGAAWWMLRRFRPRTLAQRSDAAVDRNQSADNDDRGAIGAAHGNEK